MESPRHRPLLGPGNVKFPSQTLTFKAMFQLLKGSPSGLRSLTCGVILSEPLHTHSATCSFSSCADGGAAGTAGAGPHSGGPGQALTESGEDKPAGSGPGLWRPRGLESLAHPHFFPLAPAPPTAAPASGHCGGLRSRRTAPAPECCPGSPRRCPRPSRSSSWPAPSWPHPSAPEPWGQSPTAEPPPQPTAGESWGEGGIWEHGSWALTVLDLSPRRREVGFIEGVSSSPPAPVCVSSLGPTQMTAETP